MACSDPTCQALREQLCHLVSEQAMMLLFSVLLICSRVTVPQKPCIGAVSQPPLKGSSPARLRGAAPRSSLFRNVMAQLSLYHRQWPVGLSQQQQG